MQPQKLLKKDMADIPAAEMFWLLASLASSVCWLACMCKGSVGVAPPHTSTQYCLKLRMEQNLHAIGPQTPTL